MQKRTKKEDIFNCIFLPPMGTVFTDNLLKEDLFKVCLDQGAIPLVYLQDAESSDFKDLSSTFTPDIQKNINCIILCIGYKKPFLA